MTTIPAYAKTINYILDKYDLAEHIRAAMYEDIQSAMAYSYRLGTDHIIKQYPHREDMGH